jgi:hypothetical protein
MPLQQLLPNPQRDQIFEAIERAERLVHRASGSCLVFHLDHTWRFLGYCFVADGPQLVFDRSWMALIQLMAVWLSELRRHLETAIVTNC